MTTQIKTRAIENGAITGAKVAADAISSDKIAAGAVATADVADEAITVTKMAPAARPQFTRVFTSAQQTISNAGGASLAHGLTVAPTAVQVLLVCITAELGYSIGETLVWGPFWQSQERGVGVSFDATNVHYRYVAQAAPFSYVNKTTGASSALTNANWRLVIRAWA